MTTAKENITIINPTSLISGKGKIRLVWRQMSYINICARKLLNVTVTNEETLGIVSLVHRIEAGRP